MKKTLAALEDMDPIDAAYDQKVAGLGWPVRLPAWWTGSATS